MNALARALRTLAAVGALGALSFGAVPTSAAPSRPSAAPPCSVVAALSTATPRFAICFAGATGRGYVSRDGGRHWTAVGSVPVTTRQVEDVVLSALFATDHRLWVETTDGVFESPDAGQTFAQLTDPTDPTGNPGVGNSVALTSFVSSSGGTTRAVLVTTPWGFGKHGLLFDPAVAGHVGVPLPTWADGPTIPLTPVAYEITQPAVALVVNAVGLNATSPAHAAVPSEWEVRHCPAALACVTYGQPFFGAPVSVDRIAQGFGVYSLDPWTATSRVQRVSVDGTVTDWPALTAIARALDPVTAQTGAGQVTLTPTVHVVQLTRDGRHLVVLVGNPTAFDRGILFDGAAVKTPGTQIFRSDDGGIHLRRVAYGWSGYQQPRHRDRGAWPFPFNTNGWSAATPGSPEFVADGNGTIFATGRFSTQGVDTIRCSRDGGVTWHIC